jgi:hypothetical protein
VKIPVQLNFETEPDEYIGGLPPDGMKQPVKSIRLMYGYIASRRARLAEITGAPVNFNWMWRCDSEFEIKCGPLADLIGQHQDLIVAAREQGDEIGAHFHPLRWNETAGEWEFPYADQPWIHAQLLKSLQNFEKLMGFRPESVRLSDNILLTEEVLDLMEDFGIKRDITIEPHVVGTHMAWKNVPSDDNFHDFPLYPYQPERGNFRQPGTQNRRDIWMLLTTTNYVSKAVKDNEAEIEQAYVALDLAFHPPTFAEIMNRQLESLERPYLLIVGNSNISILPQYLAYFEANVDFLINHPLASLFQFVNSAGLVEMTSHQATAQAQSSPIYQNWLWQRNLQRKQELEASTQAYRKLELYARNIEQHLGEKQAYIDSLETSRTAGQIPFARIDRYTSALKARLTGKR